MSGSSASHCQPLGQELRQTSFRDFLLCSGEIVFYSQKFDEVVLDIVNAISRAPVSVTRLAHASGVDEIFFASLNTNVLGSLATDAVIAHKYHRHMRVAEKTDPCALIRKTRHGIEIVEHVAPLPGRIESGVHDGKILNPLLQRQAAEPLSVLLIQAFARPLDRAFGELVETLRRLSERRLLVVVAFHHRAIELADKLDAFTRICVVTHDVAQADEVRASAPTRIRHHGFKRFEIGMNVTENGEPHLDPRKPPKGQNVTTEARGRTKVLVREINFVAPTDLRS